MTINKKSVAAVFNLRPTDFYLLSYAIFPTHLLHNSSHSENLPVCGLADFDAGFFGAGVNDVAATAI